MPELLRFSEFFENKDIYKLTKHNFFYIVKMSSVINWEIGRISLYYYLTKVSVF